MSKELNRNTIFIYSVEVGKLLLNVRLCRPRSTSSISVVNGRCQSPSKHRPSYGYSTRAVDQRPCSRYDTV